VNILAAMFKPTLIGTGCWLAVPELPMLAEGRAPHHGHLETLTGIAGT